MATPYAILRSDLGIPNDQTVFTDAELDIIWGRVAGAANANYQERAALALMAMQIRNSAAKLHDYSLVSASEKESQIFDHLDKIYQENKAYLDDALGLIFAQVGTARVKAAKRWRRKPHAKFG